jgi:hypothetical protein
MKMPRQADGQFFHLELNHKHSDFEERFKKINNNSDSQLSKPDKSGKAGKSGKPRKHSESGDKPLAEA